MLGLLQSGRNRARRERAAFTVYSAAVGTARDSWFYNPQPAGLGVPDTLDGRFDLISLYVFLVIRQLRRLPEPGPAIAQGVFDAMFSDMDRNLREMGVGDLGVSKRVRSMWEAFHGRAVVYQAALDAAEQMDGTAPLAEALARNVWRGEPVANDATEALARLVRRQAVALEEQDLSHGVARFLRPEEAAE